MQLQPLTFFDKLRSWFYPVLVKKSTLIRTEALALYYFQGQYQLSTADAIYSDGSRYRPALIAIKQHIDLLKHAEELLVLGTGLASIVHVLNKYHCYPAITLVDIDKEILDWAAAVLPKDYPKEKVSFVAADAMTIIQHCEAHSYDCLFVDLFIGQCLPDAATQTAFLMQCKKAIKPGGLFIMNYIATDFVAWKYYQKRVQDVYPNVIVIENDINKIMTAIV
jgi:spermidine synthase